MIPHPSGWTVTLLDDAELLVPPQGLGAGAIRYVERLAPVRSVAELLDAQLAEDPEFETETISAPRELITAEGEYAAMVEVAGRLRGAHVRRAIGYVFADEHYARVGGVALRPEMFDELGEMVGYLVYHSTHMLGVRRRRFRFARPAGWTEVRVGLRAELFAPGFPDDPGAITVWPAMPLGLGGAAFADGLGRGSAGPFAVRTRGGLSGDRWERVLTLDGGGTALRELVVLRDERYVYTLRCEHSDPAHREDFLALLESVEALPRPALARAADERGDLMSHWC